MDKITFTKAEALSNDFIIIDDRAEGRMNPAPGEIIRLCDRRLGIGADGILLLQSSQAGDFKMRTLNADGSEAEMCGNGIRCATKYVYDDTAEPKDTYMIDTLAGIKSAAIQAGADGTAETIRVDLGEPIIEKLSAEIEVLGHQIEITTVSMGNPHAVTFVNDVNQAPVEHLGPVMESHEYFPDKTNVEFIHVTGPDSIDMRVWERGAGETAACGTGAAAALAAAHVTGRIGRKATLRLKGGDLEVEWPDDGHIYITGGATMVFTGTISGG